MDASDIIKKVMAQGYARQSTIKTVSPMTPGEKIAVLQSTAFYSTLSVSSPSCVLPIYNGACPK